MKFFGFLRSLFIDKFWIKILSLVLAFIAVVLLNVS